MMEENPLNQHVIAVRDAFERMTVLNQLRQTMQSVQAYIASTQSVSFDQAAVANAIRDALDAYYRTFWPSIVETQPYKKGRPVLHVLLPHEVSGAGRNYVCYAAYGPEDEQLRYMRGTLLPPLRFRALSDTKPKSDTWSYVQILFNAEIKKLPSRGHLSPALRNAGYGYEYSLAPLYSAHVCDTIGHQTRIQLAKELFKILLPLAYMVSDEQEGEIYHQIYTAIVQADSTLVTKKIAQFRAYMPRVLDGLLSAQPQLQYTDIVNFLNVEDAERRTTFLRDYPWAAFSQLHHQIRHMPEDVVGDALAAKIFGIQPSDAPQILSALKRLSASNMPTKMAQRPTAYASKLTYFSPSFLPQTAENWQILCDAIDRDAQFAQLRLRSGGETLSELVALSAAQPDFWGYLETLTSDLGAVPAMAERHGRELIIPFLASMARDRGWHELEKNEDFIVLACTARGLKPKPLVKAALDSTGGKPLISLLYKDWALDAWAKAAKQFEIDSKYTARAPSGENQLVPSLLSLRTEGITWKALPTPPRTIEQDLGVQLVPVGTLANLWEVSKALRSTRLYEASDVLLGRAHFVAGYLPYVGLVAIARLNEDKGIKNPSRLRLAFDAARDVEAMDREMLMVRNRVNSDTQRHLGRVAEAITAYVKWLNEAPLIQTPSKKLGYSVTVLNDDDGTVRVGHQPIPAESVSPAAFEQARRHWVEQSEKARGLSAVCGGNPFDSDFNAAMTRMHKPYIPDGFDMRTTTGALVSQALVQAVDTMMRGMRQPQPSTPAFKLVKR